MEKVIVLIGQTAVGKTALSIQLAKALNGEIINGDAMQVYKGLNILTAKIKEEEKEGISHHLFDMKDIHEDYSVEEYQRNIRKKIQEITERKKMPIVVGGTGFYIKAALFDYCFHKQEISNKEMEEKYAAFSNEQLYQLLKSVDSETAKVIHPNNRRRVLRALCIYQSSGETKSEMLAKQQHRLLYDAKIFALTLPKEILQERINLRVEKMFQDGLLEEVKDHPTTSTASKAIGYKECQQYLSNQISLEEAKSLIKIHTRQYAKRQMTWMKYQLPVTFVENDENALKNILSSL